MKTMKTSIGMLALALPLAAGAAPNKPLPASGKPVFSAVQTAPPSFRVRRPFQAQTLVGAKPDLVVLDPTKGNWVPASGNAPGGYQILWRVSNRGGLRADRPTKLALACESVNLNPSIPDYAQDDANICASFRQVTFVDPLEPNQNSTPFTTLLRFGYNPQCFLPHARVTATADADGALPEGIETNNVLTVEFCQ